MKEYRSAIRSRNMIKKAFIDLLNEHELQNITVVDVVNRADISRNTFYAHYNDIYDVLNDLENEFIDKLRIYLVNSDLQQGLFSPAPIIEKIIRYVETDPDTSKIFLNASAATDLYEKIKFLFKEKINANIIIDEIKDVNGFNVFLECISCGFISLYKEYLTDGNSITADDLSRQISALFIFGIELYK